MNKRAQFTWGKELSLFPYKILFMAVPLIIVIAMFVAVFFYKNYDVRDKEAEIIAGKIAECYFPDMSIGEFKELDLCGINFNENYYVNLTFYKNELKKFESKNHGNDDMEVLCRLDNLKKPIQGWRCFSYSMDLSNGKMELLIAIKEDG